MLTLIVARARNGAIGKDNTIPWHAPEDLAFFQRETTGGAIIMGRNTWDSLPFKPLKNRMNLVLSSQDLSAEHVFSDWKDATKAATLAGYGRVYGIGGARVYAEMLPFADRLLITEVEIDIPDADTFFPDLRTEDWQEINRMPLPTSKPACVVVEYLRRPGA